MIRRMKQDEIDEVGEIWLNGNLEAHDFVDKNYWLNYLDDVKEQLKQADIYVYDEQGIQGFAGLKDEHIAGIFVKKEFRNHGVGKKLLDYLKQHYDKLSLDVYEKNHGARKFYHHNDFTVSLEDVDPDNDEKEYQLVWNKG
ncbi:GNAT family N-acetyltransferase [Companilactobacillus zhachilii]|uniref:GNAT family N-acetyltransferase n=1 Tax=Companilactobacillus zhachilii TaxID=2304606 RepID=A0A386PPY2_9LACO|nr:GNAT family N-acetyltransferase [Companilactobacillus zhachilii]AYE37784.1 GNAT family N-acetyltransferase [Companilactobacillus zhachilii]